MPACVRCSALVSAGTSPELSAALQGVDRVELFLGGEGVCKGLGEDKLVRLALQAGVSVVLPSGVGLATVRCAGQMPF
jgi:hypothetical protein